MKIYSFRNSLKIKALWATSLTWNIFKEYRDTYIFVPLQVKGARCKVCSKFCLYILKAQAFLLNCCLSSVFVCKFFTFLSFNGPISTNLGVYHLWRRGFNYYTPRERSSGGYIGITLSVRLSVCPSVCADSCPAHNFFMVWHWLTIFGTWVYHHETMCRVHSLLHHALDILDLKVNFMSSFTKICVQLNFNI